MKKKLFLLLLLLVSVLAFAADVSISGADGASIPVYQFTQSDMHHQTNPGQPNECGNAITVSVKGGTSVYVSNFVKSWWMNQQEIPALGATDADYAASGNNVVRDYNRGYDMSAGKYGYMFVETGTIKPLDNVVHYGTGQTVDIKYATGRSGMGSVTNDFGQRVTFDDSYLTTKGYYLGTFAEDADILLFMTTPVDAGNYTVNSVGFINPTGEIGGYRAAIDWDPSKDPTSEVIGTLEDATQLAIGSRSHWDTDQAGNVRWNFGFRNYMVEDENGNLVPVNARSREFILLYGDAMGAEDPDVTGQPLPGLLSSCLVALGAIVLRKRRSNKR